MWWEQNLRCPVCGSAMQKENHTLACGGARRHTFDFAAQGYVNLAGPRAAGGGDDAALIAARRTFLSAGHYAPFAARVVAILGQHLPLGATVLDAGCGEGYYTGLIAESGYKTLGLDLSKRGIRAAASAAKGKGLDALFLVAGIFDMPIADASLDAVVSLFAPIDEREILRVLKPGGLLLTAAAGREHLWALKCVLYDTPRENEPRADLPAAMTLLDTVHLTFDMALPAPDLQSLFAMTPYYYRTSREGLAALQALDSLTVGAAMDIAVYRK
ncbi:MAG: methyltransferase domain-containing protein [Clostridia bacterium]|nr:methyltransferase domain-containing protein [Clostridia bacterium]